MNIGTVTTSITSMSMARVIRQENHIPIGIGTRLWCIVIRTILTCIIAMGTGMRIELDAYGRSFKKV